MKKVEIEWMDAKIYGSVWLHSKDDFDLATCHTIGYLVSKDKEKIVVAQTYSEDDIANVQVIPAGWIKKIKEIK